MESDLYINPDLVIPASELWVTVSRSSGPGGQHVNKTSTRVSLHWSFAGTQALNPVQKARLERRLGSRITQEGVLSVHVEDTRSQQQNREIARCRLAELLAWALRTEKKRVPTKPKTGAKKRRLEDKRRHSLNKRLRGRPLPDD